MQVNINKTIEQCDVLVVGGGIGGLMAAIAAADGGAKVIVAEKANTKRSGSGATGNDHFKCYIPEVHGPFKPFLKEFQRSQLGAGGMYDVTLQVNFFRRTLEVAEDWHRWGINMKTGEKWGVKTEGSKDGFWFNGHNFPGELIVSIKYDGRNQKSVLTTEALKRGVLIRNKIPITEFLVNDEGQIIGAFGIDISGTIPEIKIFKAKAVISTTGNTSRLYPSVTPGWLFNGGHSPANAGTGRAAAYKVGAKLVNMDVPNTHAGPKYFERCGKATWVGVCADPQGNAVGPFLNKPTKEFCDMTMDIWKEVYTEKVDNGTGPVYLNCTDTAEEDMAFMKWGFECEGATSISDAMDKWGIDLKKDMVEFTKYNVMLIGRGIQIDEHARTNVPGLYAAGDEVGNFRADITGAAVYGRIAGEDAAQYAADHDIDLEMVEHHPAIMEAQAFYSQLMSRENGPVWKELNMAVQQIMNDYAGIYKPRSESMMSAGQKYLGDLEKHAKATLRCADSHELMRALEAFDLLFLGQLMIAAMRERKETRGMHKRSDYTFTNPLLDGKFITIQRGDYGPILEWRKRKELDEVDQFPFDVAK